jgi:hypothetical protein
LSLRVAEVMPARLAAQAHRRLAPVASPAACPGVRNPAGLIPSAPPATSRQVTSRR